jgi:2'-phosphotransferase
MNDPSCSDTAPGGAEEAAAGAGNAPSEPTAVMTSNQIKKLRKLSYALSWLLRHKAKELNLPVSEDGYVPVEACLSCSHAKFSDAKYTLDDVRAVVATNDKQRFKLEERFESDFYPHKAEGSKRKRNEAGTEDNVENVNSDKGEVGRSHHHRRTILCIRANQGHSIPGIDPNQLLTRLTPEELAGMPVVVHGTYTDVWENHIRTEGLRRMERNHIHFATGTPPAKNRSGGSGTEKAAVVSGMRKSCQVYIYVDASKCARDGIEFYRSDNGVLLTSGIDGTLSTEYFSHATTPSGEILLDRRAPADLKNDSPSTSVEAGANNDS